MAQQTPIIKVLVPLHQGVNTLDVVGPVEALTMAKHDIKDEATKAFEITFATKTPSEPVSTSTAITLSSTKTIDFTTAHKTLATYDILLVPGGNTAPILSSKSEPLPLITAFSALQKKDPQRERTLISICTGSLILAQAGILHGLSATTHPDFLAKFEIINGEAAQRDMADRCDIVEETYVVNNLRFDLDDPTTPTFTRRQSVEGGGKGRRPSFGMGRKGSNAWQESNSRRESNARRAGLRLGGLRVITSGGVSTGVDAALYLVSAMVSEESAVEVEGRLHWTWRKGIVVDGVDV